MPQFSSLGLTFLTEPLFLANWLLGAKTYDWRSVSMDGKPVRSSSGNIHPVALEAEACTADEPLFVLASFDGMKVTSDPKLLNLLRRLARHGATLGGLETGNEALARAGLLDGHRAAVHWENAAGFRETFPRVSVSNRSFEIDRTRITSAGALANLQLMLHILAAKHGEGLSNEISRHLLLRPTDESEAFQSGKTAIRESVIGRRVRDAVAIMQAHLETPVSCPAVAEQLSVSLRQLERNFVDTFGMSPKRYYQVLRLNHAHSLLQQTTLSVTEVAVSTGFASTEHFSRAYRAQFGEAPSRDRAQVPCAPAAWTPDGLAGSPAR